MESSRFRAATSWLPFSSSLPRVVKIIVNVKGKARRASATEVDGRVVVVDGRWLKVAHVRDEEVAENAALESPDAFIANLLESGLQADLFAFRQNLIDPIPRLRYAFAWDNLAVIPVTSYADWWDKRLSQDTRRNVRRAQKRGVVVAAVPFNDDLVSGIKTIYDETPLRQGRPFWHYGKALNTIKEENGTYLDRSAFIGAFFDGKLIGYIRMVYVDGAASIVQILSKNEHYDKRPANALIAKAVELCEQNGKSHLIYCNYDYGKDENSPLTEFKRRNGFEKMSVPRYYVPLTPRGRFAMEVNLHRGIREVLPQKLVDLMRRLRTRFYTLRAGRTNGNSSKS
jgi:hypothetical protein